MRGIAMPHHHESISLPTEQPSETARVDVLQKSHESFEIDLLVIVHRHVAAIRAIEVPSPLHLAGRFVSSTKRESDSAVLR